MSENKEASLIQAFKDLIKDDLKSDFEKIVQIICKKLSFNKTSTIFAALIPELNIYCIFFLALLAKLKKIVGENLKIYILVSDSVLPIEKREQAYRTFQKLIQFFLEEKDVRIDKSTEILPDISPDERYTNIKLSISHDELTNALSGITAASLYYNLAAVDLWLAEYFVASTYIEECYKEIVDGVLLGADKYKIYELVKTKMMQQKVVSPVQLPSYICIRQFFKESRGSFVLSADDSTEVMSEKIIRASTDKNSRDAIINDLQLMYNEIYNVIKEKNGFKEAENEQDIETKFFNLFKYLKEKCMPQGKQEKVRALAQLPAPSGRKVIKPEEYDKFFDLMKTPFNRYLLKLIYTKMGLNQRDYAIEISLTKQLYESLRLRGKKIPTTNVHNFFEKAKALELVEHSGGKYYPKYRVIEILITEKHLARYKSET
ncbi:MAG: hypothetical protein QXO15_06305 [Nitrososphaerota archaeon]